MAAPRVPNPAKGDAPRVKTNQGFLRLSRRLDALEAALAALGVDVGALEDSVGGSSGLGAVHAASFGFTVGAAGAWYVPWGPWQNEASGGAESVANCWRVPFTGTITGARIHTSADAGDVTLTIRDNNLTQLAQEVETVTSITIGANTDFAADYTFDLDVSAGDLIVMGANFAANPANVLGWLYLES